MTTNLQAAPRKAELDAVAPIVAEWIRSRGASMDGSSYFAACELAAFVKSNLAAAPASEGAAYQRGIQAVAAMLQKKADDYAQEFGCDDMGSLSFGQGSHAQAKLEYHSGLIELAEEGAITKAWGEISAQMYQKMTPWEFYKAGWHACRAALATDAAKKWSKK